MGGSHMHAHAPATSAWRTHATGCPGTAFSAAGVLEVTEAVPFRLTPNLQHFITPVGLEGIFSASLMAIARSLADPEVRLPPCARPPRASVSGTHILTRSRLRWRRLFWGVSWTAANLGGVQHLCARRGGFVAGDRTAASFERAERADDARACPAERGARHEPRAQPRVPPCPRPGTMRAVSCAPRQTAHSLTADGSPLESHTGPGRSVAARAPADSAPDDGGDQPSATESNGPDLAAMALKKTRKEKREKEKRVYRARSIPLAFFTVPACVPRSLFVFFFFSFTKPTAHDWAGQGQPPSTGCWAAGP